MIAIAFRFLAGRYHATPWDRHANEGVVDWPPSPWRVLRSLVSASYRLEPRPSREEMNALVEQLAEPPLYDVPAGAVAHTRHYMPSDDKPTLVFDTFVAVGGGAGDDSAELFVAWPSAELDHKQLVLLDRLLAHLGYLGRSESWVEARRTEWNGTANVQIDRDEAATARERIRVKALLARNDYEEWKAMVPQPGPKRQITLPVSALDVLEQDSGILQKQGWSEPPGTQTVVYRRPDALLQVRPAAKRAKETKPTFARYSIRSAVLPLLTEAITVAERLRIALLSRANSRGHYALRLFSGHDEYGNPMTGNRHAFYLPVDDDDDGRIDHLVVWAPGGFDPGARDALASLHRLWGREGHDLHLAMIGLGDPEQYGSGPGGTHLVGPAAVWESRTPFILPRHPKLRRGAWVDAPEDQLRRLLSEFHLQPAHIERIDATIINGRSLEWFRFRRERNNGTGSKASQHGFGFRLHFNEPVVGPIAVGYAAHVGLGHFRALT